MEEEVINNETDPILAKLNSKKSAPVTEVKDTTVVENEDPILKKLNAGLKKKDSPEQSQKPISSAFTEQFEPGYQPSEQPSQKSTPKVEEKPLPKRTEKVGFFNQLGEIWDTLVKEYDDPVKQSTKEDPLVTAAKRGWNLGDQAEIINPFSGIPDKKSLEELAKTQKKATELPASKEYQEFSSSETFGGALKKLSENPTKIIAELTVESLSSIFNYGATRMAAGAGLGAAAGSIVPGIGTAAGAGSGVIAGLAETSLALEYSSKYVETLKEAGVDVTDPASLEKAFADDEIMSKARESALKKSIPIAIFDLISGGVAGKIIAKPAKSIIGKGVAGAGEFAIQAALGGGGEAAGQVVAGEKINPGAILSEMVGELGTTPVEVAANTFGGVKKLVDESKTTPQVVTQETTKVDVKDTPSIDTAAENIQSKIDQNEATIEKGETERIVPMGDESANEGAERISENTEEKTLPEETQKEAEQTVNPVENEPVKTSTVDGGPVTENITPEQTAEEKPVSGIKKALVPEEVVETIPVDKRTDKQVLEMGKADVDSGKINPQSIIESVKKESRALQADEVAALVYHKARLDNQVTAATNKLEKANESGNTEEIATAKSELESLNNQLNDYYEVSVKTANQQSMAFRLRKMLLDSEYNLQSQVAKYKAASGGTITPEVQKKFEELDTKLKEANAKIDKLQSQQANSVDNKMLERLREVERKARVKAITKEKKQKISSFFDNLKVDTGNKGVVSAAVIPGITLLPHVWNGSVEVVKQAVLAGADVAQAIQAGIDYIKKNNKGEFDEKKYRDEMSPRLQEVFPKSKERPTATRNKDNKLSIPKQLIKDLVESGVKDIEELTDQVHSLVKEELPDVTTREVRDAITGYGKVATMSQEEIDVDIRKMKRIGKMISQMEDIQDKIRPMKSGLQRDKLTAQERKMQREINEALKDLPMDADQEANLWKSALDKIKTRLTNQITDLENQIKTGEKTPKKKGVEYDQEALALQSQRDELKKILRETEEEQGLSDEQRVRQALQSANKSFEEYDRRVREGDFSKKASKPTPQTPELTEAKAKRDAAKAQYDKIKAELGVTDKARLEARKKAVGRSIVDMERRIKEGDFVRKKPEEIKPDKELADALLERERVKYDFDVAQEKARLDNRTFSEKLTDFGMDVINLPKSLLSSLDFSAALRQGGYLLPSHPRIWAKAFVEMFRQTASEKRYQDYLLNLKASDLWPLVQKSKLFVAENNAKISAREEQFISRLARKIPIIGQSIKIYKNISIPGLDLIGKSNRAYSGFLNKLRVDVFAYGVDQMQKDGKTIENSLEEYRSYADFINNATGRGKLLKAGQFDLEGAAPVLNATFFSPRFLASRLNLMNPVYYAKLSPFARKQALISSLSYVAFGMAILAIAGAAGAEVEDDPRSTDFGKIKVGNTRYDIWGGFQSTARFLSQMATGEKKTSKGTVVKLDGKKFGSDDRLDVLGRFLRGKLAPVPATAVNALVGKNIVGEEVEASDELIKNTVPLYLQDMTEMFEKEGAAGALESTIPALFGIGVQNYEPRNKRKKAPESKY